jgi:hypothetical protein
VESGTLSTLKSSNLTSDDIALRYPVKRPAGSRGRQETGQFTLHRGKTVANSFLRVDRGIENFEGIEGSVDRALY